MDGARLTNVFYEQRGPLVFSASLHLVLLVAVAIGLLVSPDKEPEDFNFELVPPPSGGFAPAAVEEMPTLEDVKYESEPMELPSLDDIELPERPPIVVEVEMPPEPAPVVKEEPKPAATAPKAMSWEEFQKQNKDADKAKNIRTKPLPVKRPKIDLSHDVKALQTSLSKFALSSLPSAEIREFTPQEMSERDAYLSSFYAALERAVEDHPIRGAKLHAFVMCDISATGIVSNGRITQSSGDRVFDRKVLDAIKKLRNFYKPPHGGFSVEIDFSQ